MKEILALAAAVALVLPMNATAQTTQSGDGNIVMALDNSWNRALESNDTKALDLLLADRFVSIDIDGSIQTKGELLASLKAPGYAAPTQAVTEQSNVHVYGDSAIVVGIYHTRGRERGKAFSRRERFADTWAKIDGTWKCVASIAVLIPGK